MLGKWPFPNRLSEKVCLGGRTLDQESPGSSPGGATFGAASDYPVSRFAYPQGVSELVGELLRPVRLSLRNLLDPVGAGWFGTLILYDGP
jgi:hypothetical protein